eukprot:m.470911 g.470911  ORF g.470911 m.470911 type:complete len:236 (-) comp20372_c0_seq3:1587-2294(-)
MAAKHVLVYGGKGALGSACVSYFKRQAWRVTSVDLVVNEQADSNVVVSTQDSWQEQARKVQEQVNTSLSGEKLGAVICVAGGWAGGNALSEDLVVAADLMWRQSVWPAVISAKVAAHHLAPNGLLTFTGALPALGATPGMLGYGMAKAAVHQLTKSLAAKGSGLPNNTSVVGLLPLTLDTEANRKFMPEADHGSWTPLDFFAKLCFDWAVKDKAIESGALVQLVTKKGETSLVIE